MKPAITKPTTKSPPIAAIIPPITTLAIMYTMIAVKQPLSLLDEVLLLVVSLYAFDGLDCVEVLVGDEEVDILGLDVLEGLLT